MGRNHHDQLFKATFRDPQNLAVLLRANLPATLVDELDLASTEEVPGTLIDPNLTERFSDLLFRVHLAGRASFVYVLAEHQSTPSPLMALRLLIYLGRIWDRWLRESEQRANPGGSKVPKRIPAILPLVVFQGPGGWTAAVEFHDLIDLSRDQLAAVRHHIPSFRYALENLADLSDADIRDRPLSPLGTIGLVLLKHARDRREAFARAIEDFVEVFWRLSPDDKEMVARYTIEVMKFVSRGEVERVFARATSLRLRETMMTHIEQLEADFMRRGRAEGHMKGRAEGRTEGRTEGALAHGQEMLATLLRARFSTQVTGDVEARLLAATREQIDAWVVRFATATTLDEVFAG